MITVNINDFKPITEKTYEEFAGKPYCTGLLNIYSLKCPLCEHCGCMERHGYYKRTCRTENGTIRLTVLRVICKSCGHTHAILPESLVPYSQIPVTIQHTVIRSSSISDKAVQDIMNSNPDITESDIYHIRSNFRLHWDQRLRSINADISLDTPDLSKMCYANYTRQFMQIHLSGNEGSDFTPP